MVNRKFLFACVLSALLLGGCAKKDSSYFPLRPGLSWTYQYTSKGNSGVMKLYTLESRQIAGKDAVPVVYEIGALSSIDFFAPTDSGIYRVANQSRSDPEPQILAHPDCMLKFPLKVGTTWDDTAHTWLLSSHFYKVNKAVACKVSVKSMNETVTVPAGTFSNCIKTVERGNSSVSVGMYVWENTLPVQVEVIEWYAPGVGLVKSISKNTIPRNLYVESGEEDLQLQAFNEK